MHCQRSLIRLLLVLLLLMQYAALAHSTEHHLSGDQDHCSQCTLQQQFGQAGMVVIDQSTLPAAAAHFTCPGIAAPAGHVFRVFDSRAPPVWPLN